MQSNDRQLLRFAEIVETEFAYLLERGFNIVLRQMTLVRFESGSVYINIYHGRKSFELGLEIGPVGIQTSEAPFSMAEIIRLVDPVAVTKYRNYAAVDSYGVQEGVSALARLLRLCIERGTLQRADLFDSLRAERENWAHKFARDVQLEQTREQLPSVWGARDYLRVVQLLEPISVHLTDVERKKLDYARKHLQRAATGSG